MIKFRFIAPDECAKIKVNGMRCLAFNYHSLQNGFDKRYEINETHSHFLVFGRVGWYFPQQLLRRTNKNHTHEPLLPFI